VEDREFQAPYRGRDFAIALRPYVSWTVVGYDSNISGRFLFEPGQEPSSHRAWFLEQGTGN
jgi:hypothetical protein